MGEPGQPLGTNEDCSSNCKAGTWRGQGSSHSASTHCTLKPSFHARSGFWGLSRSVSLSVNPSLMFSSPGPAPVCGGCRPIFGAELCEMRKGSQQTWAKHLVATQASTGKTPARDKILKEINKDRVLQGTPWTPCPFLPRACWASKGSTNI